jgi:hypothetical protein
MSGTRARNQALGIGTVVFVLVLVILALTWVKSASDTKIQPCSTATAFDDVNGGSCEEATKRHELALAGSVAVAFVGGMTVYSVTGRRLGATF